MNLGDIIEWVYKSSNKVVDEDEELWSTLIKKWVPTGSSLTHILISIDNERICWLNEKGYFHVHVDDTFAWIPRARR